MSRTLGFNVIALHFENEIISAPYRSLESWAFCIEIKAVKRDILARPFTMQLVVRSTIPRNHGTRKKVEISEDDEASDLIRNVCNIMCIDHEPRMYLRLPLTGAEIGGRDKIGDFIGYETEVLLCTRRISQLRWISSISCLLAGIVLVITGSALYRDKTYPERHGVVIDAGSSHTSTFLYSWPGELEEGNAVVEEVDECYVDRGIDSFSEDPEGVRDFLEVCLNQTAGLLQSHEEVRSTRVFLGATAGMRLLNLSDPLAAAYIIGNASAKLDASGFDFVSGDAEILSGSDEGAFAWIGTNIITEAVIEEDRNTTGSLDMGGASSQIAFQSDKGNIEFSIYGQDYNVFSDSLLCYGLDEAMKRFVAWLALEAFDGTDIDPNLINPCVNPGHLPKDNWLENFPTDPKLIFGTPCTVTLNEDFNEAIENFPGNFSFTASYNQTLCREALDVLLDHQDCSETFAQGSCLDNDLYPSKSGDYFAVSSYFWEFWRTLGIDGNSTSLDKVKNKVDQVCSGEIPEDCDWCSETDCFEVTYILDFLTYGYGFGEDSFERISFVEDVNGESVGWALGFMVAKSSEIEPSFSRAISGAIFALMLVFGLGMAALGSTAICVFHRKHNNRVLRRV